MLHEAAVPDSPSGPSMTMNVAVGALAGLVIGVIVALRAPRARGAARRPRRRGLTADRRAAPPPDAGHEAEPDRMTCRASVSSRTRPGVDG